jgi:hypothetical protein
VAVVGNLVSYLRAKSKTESVTPDTAFRFNSSPAVPRQTFSTDGIFRKAARVAMCGASLFIRGFNSASLKRILTFFAILK